MHGIIFAELKKFVVAKHGGKTWNDLLQAAGLPDKIFVPNQTYPDSELVAIVVAASKALQVPAQDLLVAFGAFIAPDLLSMYKAQLDPTWRTLDMIANTEQIIHRTVRAQVPGATPPELDAKRESPTRLILTYRSQRKLCGVAKGLAQGVAEHYKEHIRIAESSCMLQGAPACTMVIDLVP